jgi:sugar/nucleoside kinase (ribokinase family)
MSPEYDVLVVGDYCLDLIFTGLPNLPQLGREVFGSGFAMIPGGTYNNAVAMHRLGLKVAWAADFGNDDFSQFVETRALQEGLPESHFVHHSRALRNITAALSFPEERAFVTYYDTPPSLPAAMKALPRVSARMVYLPGVYHGPFLDAGLLLVRAKKMRMVMGGNFGDEVRLDMPSVRRACQSADLFLPNADEARRMTGIQELDRAIRRLAEVCPLVVVKDGPNGAFACSRGEILHMAALSLQPVDTTGAGDCFDAGFVKAWLEGRPLADCLRWGNIVGGLSTLALGGTGRFISSADVEQRLNSLG